MYPAKIVVGEMQLTGCFQIIELLRKSIGQPRKTADCLPHRKVLPFDETGRDVAHVWPPIPYFYYRLYHRRWRVPTSAVMLSVVAVYLYQLCEVCLSRKNIFHAFAVEVKPIGRDLQAMFGGHTVAKGRQESVSSFAIALANCVRRNQFCVGINRHEDPSIPYFWRVLCFYMTLFLLAERPDFIRLNPFAGQVLHLGFHQSYATFASQHQQTHNRIAVQSGDPFSTPNAGSFDQELNCQHAFIFGNAHRAKQPRVFFGECLPALSATETLKAIAMLSKLSASDLALRAIHDLSKLQQALAVCQEKTKAVGQSERAFSPIGAQTGGVV